MQPGDWVEWYLPMVFLRRGQVVRATDTSLEIRILGQDETTVIPVIEYAAGELRRIEEPPQAARVERDRLANMMTPVRAASILGVDLKRLRVMLREGRLVGRQVNGRWVEVESDSVDASRN